MLPPPPPRLEDLRYGTMLAAGLGQAMVIPDIDVETASEAGYVWNEALQRWDGPPGAAKGQKGLPVVGAEPYAKHPTCRVIWLSYDLKDGLGRRRWRPGLPPPLDLWGYVAAGGLLEAWNVGFERWIWLYVLGPRHGFPPVREEQWRCAMAKARAFGLPGALGKAGEVMGLDTQKDKAGAALIKKFSMPRNPTQGDPRRWILPVYDGADALVLASQLIEHARAPDDSSRKLLGITARAFARAEEDRVDTQRYGDYNETDIATEAELMWL